MAVNRQTDEMAKRIDLVIDALMRSSPTILAAHMELGIPLEDAICAAVRRSLAPRPSIVEEQLCLFPAAAASSPIRKGRAS